VLITDILISSFTISFCIIFAILNFAKYRETKSKNLLHLCVFFVLTAVFFVVYLYYIHNDLDVLVYLFPLSLPIYLSLLPSFYIYIYSFYKPIVKNKIIFLNYLPSIIFLVLLIPFYFIQKNFQIDYLQNKEITHKTIVFLFDYIHNIYLFGVVFVINIQLFLYIYLFIKLLLKFKKEIENRFSYKEYISLEWATVLIIFLVLLILLLNFSGFIGVKNNMFVRIIYNFISVIIISYLYFKSNKQKNIYNNSIEIEQNISQNINIIETEHNLELNNQKKYQYSWLKEVEKEKIIEQIDNLIYKSDFFYNTDLSIEILSKKLNTNTTYLSQILNEHYKQNFFNFVNTLRIKKAAKLLTEKEFDKYTIEAIANISGFGSRTSFYEAFKKIYGSTPTQYKKTLQTIK